MKSALLGLLCILAGCASDQPSATAPVTTFTYFHGEVRAINLLLHIKTSQRLSDSSWKITAQGTFETKIFNCVLTIPAHWSDDPRFAGAKRADIIFADDGSGAILDDLVQRHYGKVPSVFAESGFGVFARDSGEHIDRERFKFEGFANAPDDSKSGELQCLVFLNVPERYLKLAFLVEGYGGTPPEEVYQWLRKTP